MRAHHAPESTPPLARHMGDEPALEDDHAIPASLSNGGRDDRAEDSYVLCSSRDLSNGGRENSGKSGNQGQASQRSVYAGTGSMVVAAETIITTWVSSLSIHMNHCKTTLRSVAPSVLPIKVFAVSLATASTSVAVVQATCDFLAAEAQRQFAPEDRSTWPQTWCDYRAGQHLHASVLHELIIFFAMAPRGIMMIMPSVIARRQERVLSRRCLIALFGAVVANALIMNALNVLIMVYGDGMFQSVIKWTRSLSDTMVLPVLVTCILFDKECVRSVATMAGFASTVILNFVGVMAFVRWGSPIISGACAMAASFLLVGTFCALRRDPLAEGGRFDFGSQLTLGFLNSTLPFAIPVIILGTARKLESGSIIVLCVWVIIAFLGRKMLRSLANNAVPPGWRSQAFFPWLFLEDFIPVLLFADQEALSTQFVVTAICLVSWEVIRDAPALKAYIFSLLACSHRNPQGWQCRRMRACMAGIAAIAMGLIGASAGAAAVADVVEQAGDEVGVAELKKKEMVVQIDIARHNMIGELVAIILMLVSVAVTRVFGRPPLFAWENVLLMLGLEVVKVSVCITINAKSLVMLGKQLPQIASSRFVGFNMAATYCTVSLASLSIYVFNIRENLSAGCGW